MSLFFPGNPFRIIYFFLESASQKIFPWRRASEFFTFLDSLRNHPQFFNGRPLTKKSLFTKTMNLGVLVHSNKTDNMNPCWAQKVGSTDHVDLTFLIHLSLLQKHVCHLDRHLYELLLTLFELSASLQYFIVMLNCRRLNEALEAKTANLVREAEEVMVGNSTQL